MKEGRARRPRELELSQVVFRYRKGLSPLWRACSAPSCKVVCGPRRRYFQGCGVFCAHPDSCYIREVKRIISSGLRGRLGAVSILKTWEETVAG